MGIDTQAVIIVGLPRGELKQVEDLEDLIDDAMLEVAPRYYDGDASEATIVGIVFKESHTYGAVVLEWSESQILSMKEEFKKITNLEGKVYLTPVVT